MPACDIRIVAACVRGVQRLYHTSWCPLLALREKIIRCEVDGGGAFDIPVTNLKGLVSRSLSDILAFVYAATGGKGVWGAQWLSEDGLGVLGEQVMELRG